MRSKVDILNLETDMLIYMSISWMSPFKVKQLCSTRNMFGVALSKVPTSLSSGYPVNNMVQSTSSTPDEQNNVRQEWNPSRSQLTSTDAEPRKRKVTTTTPGHDPARHIFMITTWSNERSSRQAIDWTLIVGKALPLG